ncbi:MAG: hypothetical protein ABH864_06960 [archaeon]
MEKKQIAYVALAVFMVFLVGILSFSGVNASRIIESGSCLAKNIIDGQLKQGCGSTTRVMASGCKHEFFILGGVPTWVISDSTCTTYAPTTALAASAVADASAEALDAVGDITVTPPTPPSNCPTECPPGSSCTGAVVNPALTAYSCRYNRNWLGYTTCSCAVSVCAENTCTWGCIPPAGSASLPSNSGQELAHSDPQKESPMIHTQVFW